MPGAHHQGRVPVAERLESGGGRHGRRRALGGRSMEDKRSGPRSSLVRRPEGHKQPRALLLHETILDGHKDPSVPAPYCNGGIESHLRRGHRRQEEKHGSAGRGGVRKMPFRRPNRNRVPKGGRVLGASVRHGHLGLWRGGFLQIPTSGATSALTVAQVQLLPCRMDTRVVHRRSCHGARIPTRCPHGLHTHSPDGCADALCVHASVPPHHRSVYGVWRRLS